MSWSGYEANAVKGCAWRAVGVPIRRKDENFKDALRTTDKKREERGSGYLMKK